MPAGSTVALFTGPMASGKTAALLAAAMVLRPTASSFTAVTSGLDTRWGHTAAIRSRTGLWLPADPVDRLCSLPAPTPGALTVVDEAQFFPDLLEFAHRFTAEGGGGTLLVAGLDMDYRGEPFGHTQALAATLQENTQSTVRCHVHCFSATCTFGAAGGLCSKPASYTQRLLVPGSDEVGGQVLVGDLDLYQPACTAHHCPAGVSAEAWGGER